MLFLSALHVQQIVERPAGVKQQHLGATGHQADMTSPINVGTRQQALYMSCTHIACATARCITYVHVLLVYGRPSEMRLQSRVGHVQVHSEKGSPDTITNDMTELASNMSWHVLYPQAVLHAHWHTLRTPSV
jgi:hypothetical protein